jgi:aryl-alcohol dehydrogenase-like predicted oxidoreductase
MNRRQLGRSGIEVSALGMGCWAIGGDWWYVEEGQEPSPCGWGGFDDAESIRAIHAALDMGISFFDTADVYGCGHSERILGKAIAGRRNGVVIATKFGKQFDEEKKHFFGHDTSPELIRSACEASLRRLGIDSIDLYQFHWADYDIEKAAEVRDILEDLVSEGKIRFYGWSTNDVDRIRVFAEGQHCTAVQSFLSVFWDYPEVQAVCDELDLANINKQPLAMGLLTGKFNESPTFPMNDFRRQEFAEQQDRINHRIRQAEALREVLTSGGRTLAQGALGWIWARHGRAIPIPGFKNERQVRENAAAMKFGPLTADQMSDVQGILARTEDAA